MIGKELFSIRMFAQKGCVASPLLTQVNTVKQWLFRSGLICIVMIFALNACTGTSANIRQGLSKLTTVDQAIKYLGYPDRKFSIDGLDYYEWKSNYTVSTKDIPKKTPSKFGSLSFSVDHECTITIVAKDGRIVDTKKQGDRAGCVKYERLLQNAEQSIEADFARLEKIPPPAGYVRIGASVTGVYRAINRDQKIQFFAYFYPGNQIKDPQLFARNYYSKQASNESLKNITPLRTIKIGSYTAYESLHEYGESIDTITVISTNSGVLFVDVNVLSVNYQNQKEAIRQVTQHMLRYVE